MIGSAKSARFAALSCGAAIAALAIGAGAQAQDDDTLRKELDAIKAQLAAQQLMLEDANARIDAQSDRIDAQQRWLESQGELLSRQWNQINGGGEPLEVYTQPIPALFSQNRPVGTSAPMVAADSPRVINISSQDAGEDAAQDGGSPDGVDDTRPESERQADQLLVDAGGVLLPKGTLQIEPSIDFTHVSSDRVNINGFTIFNAIVIGTITVDDLSRDIVTSSMSARYAPMRRVQFELSAPTQYRHDRELRQVGTSDQREIRVENFDWGDATMTASWQPFAQKGWRPATILRLRGRAPTGTSPFDVELIPILDEDGVPTGQRRLAEAPTGSGFWGAGLSTTMVWRADPVVFFLGGGYTGNFNRIFETAIPVVDEGGDPVLDSEGNEVFDITKSRVNPGDVGEFFSGFNLALNERVSFNTSFVLQRTFETRSNGNPLAGTQATDARLVFGSSIGLTDRVSLVISAQTGLTDQSPDYSYSISVPITFQNIFG